MDFLRHQLLTILIFLPLAGAVSLLFIPSRGAVRWTALGTMLAVFGASLLLLFCFDWCAGSIYAYAAEGGIVQMSQRVDFLKSPNVQYLVGIDGLNFPLVILTAFICPLACAAAWPEPKKPKIFFALLLLLETTILGTFLSLDLALLFIFLQASILVTCLLIACWGAPRRKRAAIKFFAFSLVSALLLFIVIGNIRSGAIQLQLGVTFDLIHLAAPAPHSHLLAPAGAMFPLAMLAFLILMAAVPAHGWLADSIEQAHTSISMILAALITTMGGYGIFRVAYPLFPDSARKFWLVLAIVGAGGAIYGALCAMAQTDLKRLLAYRCISSMGFVLLGGAVMTVASINGAVFLLTAQALIAAALFFIAGAIEDRARHRYLPHLNGSAASSPLLSGFGAIAFLASLGLPGLCGFIGEILVLLGIFEAANPNAILYSQALDQGRLPQYLLDVRLLAAAACLATALTAAPLLRTMQRLFFAPENPQHPDIRQIDRRQIAILIPLTLPMVLLGILPGLFFFTFTSQTVAAFFRLFSSWP